jgi:hypothetical protein
MTELCARYGISRRVGYKWLSRYQARAPRAWSISPASARLARRAVADDVAAQ